MKKKTVVFVVGHENWGKSKTLRALTDDSYRVRRKMFDQTEFLIRRMSNDDDEDSYIDFMKSINPEYDPNLIAAICPNFDRVGAHTTEVLKALLKKGYILNFWVIEKQYGSENMVTPAQIKSLEKYGQVEVFSKVVEADVRAKFLRAFIKKVMT